MRDRQSPVATITVVGQDIRFEIDSGATASVIMQETYK